MLSQVVSYQPGFIQPASAPPTLHLFAIFGFTGQDGDGWEPPTELHNDDITVNGFYNI